MFQYVRAMIKYALKRCLSQRLVWNVKTPYIFKVIWGDRDPFSISAFASLLWTVCARRLKVTFKKRSQVPVCAHFFNGSETAGVSRLWGQDAVMGFKGGSASGGPAYSNGEAFTHNSCHPSGGHFLSLCRDIKIRSSSLRHGPLFLRHRSPQAHSWLLITPYLVNKPLTCRRGC